MNDTEHTPLWETLMRRWESRASGRINEMKTTTMLIGKSTYTEGLRRFLDTALMIADEVLEPQRGISELANICARYGNPRVLQEWLHDGVDLDERDAVVRVASTAGQMAAKRKLRESDAVRVAALDLVEALSAVAVDSLRLYPNIMGNALHHREVMERLQTLSDAVDAAVFAATPSRAKTNADNMYRILYGTTFSEENS